MLTDAKVRGLRPGETTRRVTDADGLSIEIRTSGRKYWRYRFTWLGKSSMLSIGEYPAIGLAAARRKRDEAKALLAQGIHPEHHARQQMAMTFEAVAKEWLSEYGPRWAARTVRSRQRVLEQHVYPMIGNMPVADVRPAHVLRILQTLEKDSPAQAINCRGVMGAVFRRAVATLRCEQDPTAPLRDALKPHKAVHSPILGAEAIRAFYDALDADSACYPGTRMGVELLWLVTCRSVELRDARWDEIDFDEGVWTIPADRMKRRREHTVPLTARAVELLTDLKRIAGSSPYVLPSRQDRNKPAGHTIFGKVFDRLTQGEFNPHGIRGTFSTWAHGQGYDSRMVEIQLSHVDRDKTRASYNRADLLSQRRAMLEAWENYLAGCRAGNVVQLRRRA